MLPQSFLLGANLPWVSYGNDFGANAWHPDGGISASLNAQSIVTRLSELRSDGITCLRWFLFCDGRAGLRFDPNGQALGLDDFVFRDIDAALEIARRVDMTVLFTLFDFLWFERPRFVHGVQLGGRSAIVQDSDMRWELLDRVVQPTLERYGRDPVIGGWDALNEPEWATSGIGWRLSSVSVEPAVMRRFLKEIIHLVHDVTGQAATVGLASRKGLLAFGDLPVDFHQVHWYDHLDPVASLDQDVRSIDRPILLGEFPTKGSRRVPRDVLETARRRGYAGAFLWSILADDGASNLDEARGEIADWAREHRA